jgi:acetylornithine deacetylase
VDVTAGDLTPTEQRVLERIDAAAVVELTSSLIAVPSVSAHETPGQRLVAARLAAAGMAVETFDVDVPGLAAHPLYSAEFDREEMLGVVGRAGRGDGPVLLVDGHVDVVPPGGDEDWTSPAFAPQVRDGLLYGRGACDMKGGLAAAIHAVEAIRAAGVELAGEVVVASVAAEEDGGAGTLALLQHGVTADGCIIPEPTGLAVVPAVAGALSWRITLRGLSAHGALREEGVSAIERFPVVLAAVQALEARRNAVHTDELFGWLDNPFAICGGRLAAGDWPSSEADWLTWEGRYGVAPGEDLAAARHEFEAAVATAAAGDAWLAAHPPEVTWWGGQFLPARTDLADPVAVATVGAVTSTTGVPADVRAMPYGCDMGLTVGHGGIPTVVFGPGDIRAAHRPDEHVPVADLEVAARTLAVAMLRFCGVA